MKEYLTREEAVEFDRLAMEEYGVPGIAMMENAGARCAQAALAVLAGDERPVCVLCGSGNNGGDGFVVARHLAGRGTAVRVFLACRRGDVRPGSDASTNLKIIEKMGLPITEVTEKDAVPAVARALGESALIVDALLGTGLSGPLREPYVSLIQAINAGSRPVLSIDIPSGLDSDTGEVHGVAVRADVTVTMLLPKVGFAKPGAKAYLGKVEVADIGTNFLFGQRDRQEAKPCRTGSRKVARKPHRDLKPSG